MKARTRWAALSISLPSTLRRYVEQRVGEGGFGNVSEYIRSLIRGDQEESVNSAAGQPLSGLRGKRVRKRGTALLREGDTIDLTAEDWRELRDALASGGRVLAGRRLVEAARLFEVAAASIAARVRREHPRASKKETQAAIAAWIHEREGWEATSFFREAPQRLRRLRR